MITLKVSYSTKNLDALEHGLTVFPETFNKFVRKDLVPFAQNEVTKRLRREPGAVVYPIQWTSEKQRLAFFATDGFGHGIPYQRTGQIEHDWHVIGDYRAGFAGLTVFNENPAALYIYGDEYGRHQQQFHVNTGWPTFRDQLVEISLAANDRAAAALPFVWGEAVGL